MPYQEVPNSSAGGCFTGKAAFGRHNPFNLHYFRPSLYCLRSSVLLPLPTGFFPLVSYTILQIGSYRAFSVSIGNFILICQMRAHSATRRLMRGYAPRILKAKKHHPRHKFRFMPRKLLDTSPVCHCQTSSGIPLFSWS